MWYWIAFTTTVVIFIGIWLSWKPVRGWMHRRIVKHALETFRLQRELLEARFFTQAQALGKPRGLRWLDCDWQSSVAFARDRQTGLITAFAGVNIRFEAIEGGDMEEVAAVGTIRDAVALFHYQFGQWGTGGRAVFNFNPQEALTRFADQYEAIDFSVKNTEPPH